MPRCPIKGFQGTSLIDYPGRIASIVYLGGCNFRCRFCYNRALVTCDALPDLDVDAVMRDLSARRAFIEGVVVTGGEPTLHPGIIDLLLSIRDLGIDVKLDTNGTHPEILEWVVTDGLAAYIAMDYKAPLDKLDRVACIRGAEARVHASAQMLIKRAPRHEFRTTVHPLLHDLDDIETIASELRGAAAYYIQQYHPFDSLDTALMDTPPYDAAFFRAAAARIRRGFKTFGIRNLVEPAAAHAPAAAHDSQGHPGVSPPLQGPGFH